jgi:hypothetical protein
MSDQGIKKDAGKNRLDLIPVECIDAIGKVLTFGAAKYHDNSWREGMNYSRIYAATQRHLQAFWGEAPDINEESKLSHLSHAFCNLAFLLAYEENKERYQAFDDRAGSSNSYYKKREEKIVHLLNLVQNNPEFFEYELEGWESCWISEMDEYVNIVCTIEEVRKIGVFMTNNIFGYPAFVLKIISK